MSSRGLLNALLGVAGELLPSVEDSLPSVFNGGNRDCNYSWVFALIAGPTYLIVGVVVLPCHQPPPKVRLSGRRFNYDNMCISVVIRTHL